MVFNLAVGLVTPPVGVNLYVGCGIAGIKLKEICKGVMPLIVASILALLLVTYIEPISRYCPTCRRRGRRLSRLIKEDLLK